MHQHHRYYSYEQMSGCSASVVVVVDDGNGLLRETIVPSNNVPSLNQSANCTIQTFNLFTYVHYNCCYCRLLLIAHPFPYSLNHPAISHYNCYYYYPFRALPLPFYIHNIAFELILCWFT
jgi:hypothetical protein